MCLCACKHIINVYVGICYEKERRRERLSEGKVEEGRERRQKEERGGEEREDK